MKSKKGLILLLAGIGVTSHNARGMESEHALTTTKPTLKIYAIAGMNAGGSKERYLRSLFRDYTLDITRIETPKEYCDLAQSQSINFIRDELTKALARDNPQNPVIMHATSQGASAIFNMIAQSGIDERIKCLIVEGAFTTGNRGITHTLKGRKAGAFGPLIHLPLSEVWTPYVARLVRFWNYCPSGPQVIKSIPDIPNRIPHAPIVIVHGGNDVRVPPEDAPAIYHGLKEHGHNDVYLIQEDKASHTHVLKYTVDAPALMRTILQKHNIVPQVETSSAIDLTPYQPDHTQFAGIYRTILDEAHMHERIATPIYAVATVAALYATYRGASYAMKKWAGNK